MILSCDLKKYSMPTYIACQPTQERAISTIKSFAPQRKEGKIKNCQERYLLSSHTARAHTHSGACNACNASGKSRFSCSILIYLFYFLQTVCVRRRVRYFSCAILVLLCRSASWPSCSSLCSPHASIRDVSWRRAH